MGSPFLWGKDSDYKTFRPRLCSGRPPRRGKQGLVCSFVSLVFESRANTLLAAEGHQNTDSNLVKKWPDFASLLGYSALSGACGRPVAMRTETQWPTLIVAANHNDKRRSSWPDGGSELNLGTREGCLSSPSAGSAAVWSIPGCCVPGVPFTRPVAVISVFLTPTPCG